MAAPFEVPSLRPGFRVLGRYELVRELGIGGMGVVWLVRDHGLGIDVAFKFLPDVLRKDRASLDELRDEARRNLRLTNESIVRIYDFVEDDTLAGITMEYVDGDTLASRKSEAPSRVLEVDELWPLVRQLCRALHYAHTQPRVVHRDLKPANLMVTRDGRLKITDFGIARSISDSFTRVSNAQPSAGTLVYMSPQQLMGEPPQPTDDIYSIGATIYDLLSGKPPFHTGSIAAQLLQSVPPRMSERRAHLERAGTPIPEEWEETVAACLAKNPEQRPATALEIIRRIEGPVSSRVIDPGETVTEPVIITPRTTAPPPTAAPVSTPSQRPPPFSTPPPKEPAAIARTNVARDERAPEPPTVPPTEYPTIPAAAPVAPAPKSSSSGIWVFISILLLILLVGSGGIIAYFARDYLARPATPKVDPKPEATTGRIMLNSVPTARVWLDGREIGTTPLTMDTVATGDHQVRLEHTDYEPLALNIEIVGGQTANVGVLHMVPVPKAPEPAPVVANEPANTNAPSKQPVETGLTNAAAEEAMVRLLAATEKRDIDGISSCYSIPVDYFDEGVLTQSKLQKSLRTYVQTWPAFDIQLLNANVAATNDPDEKIVSAKYRFVARNGSKIASGVASDIMTVRRYADGVYIRRIRQTVADRQKNF
jgi:serine/threonine protein kinase